MVIINLCLVDQAKKKQGDVQMKAIVVTDEAAGTAGMKLVERPKPDAARLASLSGASYGDVVVQVHASGFTLG